MADTTKRDDQKAMNRFIAAASRLHQGIARVFTAASGGTKADIEKKLTGVDITSQPGLRAATTFHQRVMMVRAFYDHDALFHALIDRAVKFASTKIRIRALAAKDENKSKPDLKKGMTPKTKIEQEFWDTWAKRVNVDLDNTLPGLQRVKSWNLKNFMLDGMSNVVVEIGTMKVGKEEYIVPTKITTLPGELSLLVREFDDKEFITTERSFINVGGQFDIYNTPLTRKAITEANLPEVPPLSAFDPANFDPGADPRSRQYGYVVKYNHSPSDPSTLGPMQGTSGDKRSVIQTHGLYPNPPYAHLQRILTIRQQGENSDLTILDAIINQILMVHVGDERHDIQPARGTEKGTLDHIADLISNTGTEHMMQLIVPYYVQLSKIETNTDSLVAAEKYIHSTLSLYAAFGIFIAPPQVREQFDQMNRTNFEEDLEYMIGHDINFRQMLGQKIVEWNSPKLSRAPTWVDLPTNTKQEGYMTILDGMRTRGEVSHQTFLDHADLNAGYERQVIADELANGTKEMLDDNVPIQFVQSTNEGTESSGGNKPGTQGGKSKGSTTKQSKPSGQRKSGEQVQSRPRKVASKKGTEEGEDEA